MIGKDNLEISYRENAKAEATEVVAKLPSLVIMEVCSWKHPEEFHRIKENLENKMLRHFYGEIIDDLEALKTKLTFCEPITKEDLDAIIRRMQ